MNGLDLCNVDIYENEECMWTSYFLYRVVHESKEYLDVHFRMRCTDDMTFHNLIIQGTDVNSEDDKFSAIGCTMVQRAGHTLVGS